MTLIEMNELMLNGEKKEVNYPVASDDLLYTFSEILGISPAIVSAVNDFEDSDAFFKTYADIREIIGTKFASDIFYAYKLGFYYHGVPGKLCYVVSKIKEFDGGETPNTAIKAASKLLTKYVGNVYTSEHGSYTVKDVIDNIFGKSVELLTDGKRIVNNGKCYEAYVSDIDRVVILPDDIGKSLTFDECYSLSFDKNIGVLCNGEALRFRNNRVGITKDDFDLRECV